MQVEDEIRAVTPGDAIAIPPGKRHQITNIGDETLRFLCCCAPAYEHEDTVMVDDWPNANTRRALVSSPIANRGRGRSLLTNSPPRDI